MVGAGTGLQNVLNIRRLDCPFKAPRLGLQASERCKSKRAKGAPMESMEYRLESQLEGGEGVINVKEWDLPVRLCRMHASPTQIKFVYDGGQPAWGSVFVSALRPGSLLHPNTQNANTCQAL